MKRTLNVLAILVAFALGAFAPRRALGVGPNQLPVGGGMSVVSSAVYAFSSSATDPTQGDSGISRAGAASFTMGTATQGDTTGALSLQSVVSRTGTTNGINIGLTNAGGLTFGSTGNLAFTAANDTGTRDTSISRDAAGVVDIGTGGQGNSAGSLKLSGLGLNGTAPVAATINGPGNTVTVSTPPLSLTQTWNAGGVTFEGLLANFTSTASAAGSRLLNLQLGGNSAWNVTKAGSTNRISAAVLGWSSSATDATVAADTGISRSAAASFALGNGTQGDVTGALSAQSYVSRTASTNGINIGLTNAGALTFGSAATLNWTAGNDTAARDTQIGRLGAAIIQVTDSGTNKWVVAGNGLTTGVVGVTANGAFLWSNSNTDATAAADSGIQRQSAGLLKVVSGAGAGTNYLLFGVGKITGRSADVFGWSSSATDATVAADTAISRDSAGVIDMGTGAQGNQGGTLIATSLRAVAAGNHQWVGRTVLTSTADGNLTATNNAATGFTGVLFGANQSGTDTTSTSSTTITMGMATGAGAGPDFTIQDGYKLATGTTVQSQFDRLRIVGKETALSTTSATTTTFATMALATNNTSGGCHVHYMVEANDGTNWDTACGDFTVAASNKAGTVTATAAAVFGESSNANSGTLSNASAVSVTGTTVNIRITPSWTVIVPTVVRITYTLIPFGNVTTAAG